jgi:CBS domain containing-hemolysin-like protein
VNVTPELEVVALCLVAHGFFAGMETGVVAINRHRLIHLARQGARGARMIERFLRESNRLLGTTLVGTNLSLVVASTLLASLAEHAWGQIGQTAAGALLALAVLVFGEFLPKVWFSSRPIERCLPLAGTLRLAERVLTPLVAAVLFLTRWVMPRRRQRQFPFVTRENILTMARDSEAGGQITAFERLMISRVLNLQVQTVTQVMTPLARVVRVHAEDRLDACLDLARSSGHMRLPVFDAADRNCLGVLPVLDVLSRGDPPPETTAHEAMQPPFFLAPDLQADDVLPLMRRHRHSLALVRAADGPVLGLITQENILAAIMGKPSHGAAAA